MARVRWYTVLPVLVIAGAGGRILLNPVITRGADGRIVDGRFDSIQKKVGHKLYAPAWLPDGGRPGVLGTMIGKRRILQDFIGNDDRALCILSQEVRTPDRDAYHHRIFEEKADSRTQVNGHPAYFVTGDTGERRLFWNEGDTALILCSTVLTDGQLAQVASKVK